MSESGAADEVDVIVGAWHRERPDLDVSPLEVLSRLSRISRRLDQTRAAVFTEQSLETWEFDVLSALRRAGAPYQLSPGALVQQTLVTSGTMTNRVDRLETRGWVRRLPAQNDRRSVIVELTAAGRETVDAALEALLAHEHAILASTSTAERDHLAAALRGLLQAVEKTD